MIKVVFKTRLNPHWGTNSTGASAEPLQNHRARSSDSASAQRPTSSTAITGKSGLTILHHLHSASNFQHCLISGTPQTSRVYSSFRTSRTRDGYPEQDREVQSSYIHILYSVQVHFLTADLNQAKWINSKSSLLWTCVWFDLEIKNYSLK